MHGGAGCLTGLSGGFCSAQPGSCVNGSAGKKSPCDPNHLCIGAIISGDFKLVLGTQKYGFWMVRPYRYFGADIWRKITWSNDAAAVCRDPSIRMRLRTTAKNGLSTAEQAVFLISKKIRGSITIWRKSRRRNWGR